VAHETCWKKFQSYIDRKCPTIVVDNTNLTWGDCARYVDSALTAGYEVIVVRLQCSVLEASTRNVHGVGLEHLQRMSERVFEVPTHIEANPSFRVVST
jgi:hypothetical protein